MHCQYIYEEFFSIYGSVNLLVLKHWLLSIYISLSTLVYIQSIYSPSDNLSSVQVSPSLRAGLPREHRESYHTYMYAHLFQHVDIDAASVNLLDGNAVDLVEECRRYEQAMRDAGGVELWVGGLGADGHVAFNEPGSSLSSRTRVKTLANDTVAANARFFGGDLEKVCGSASAASSASALRTKDFCISL